MHRARTSSPEMPPLLTLEVCGRLSVLTRERHELLRRLSRIAPRSRRRLDAEREIALLTRQILAAELALGGKGKR